MIKNILIASVLVVAHTLLSAGLLFADHDKYEWNITDLNYHIDQTNFIVNDNCSGTLINLKEKLILTNFHCISSHVRTKTQRVSEDNKLITREVANNRDVIVSQKFYKDYELVARKDFSTTIEAMDPRNDLALLRFKQPTISFQREAIISTTPVKRGETVYVVGNPIGLDASIHRGVISSINRTLSIGGERHHYIQIDAGIVGGNSGGALYNSHGLFIGIPSASSPTNEVIGLVTPISVITNFLKDNCYEKIFNTTALTHTECMKKKKEKSDG